MKKLLSLTLALAIIICAIPLGTFTLTASAATSGYYTYRVSNGEATITGFDTSISGDITIPSTLGGYPVTSIGTAAFSYCTNLTSITIPNSVIGIGEWAFEYCRSLTSITIPDSVTSIGDAAFPHCTSLTEIVVSKNNNKYSSQDGALFNKDKTTLIQYPIGKINTSYIIPNSVTSIGGWAFGYCESLTNITIPDSVTSIGGSAFFYCKSLTEIVVSKNNNKYSSQDGVLFNKDKTILIQYPIGKTNTSYIIPNSVTSIGDAAFQICTGLTSVIIGNSVTSIGYGAFEYCRSLTEVYYTGTKQDRENIKIGNENWELYNATWHYNKLYPDAASNDWYSEAVKYVRDNGIMSGYSNGKFGTSDSIQRQDFLVMLARLDGVNLNNYKYKSSFPDVERNSYYEAAVNWGSEKGIVTGYQNGKFGVGDKVTREQLVTFLYRYAKYKEYDYSYTNNRETVVSGQYKDFKNVSAFAKSPILWAIEKGVISGKTTTTIVPQGKAQRCEVAKIMYNIYLNDIFK